jgi:transcriptional regulator with XRE-family HTH domain
MKHQGEALELILRRLGVSITSLAEKSGVTRSTVYNWFNMATVPYENLEKISKAIGVDIFNEIEKELKITKPLKKYDAIATVAEPSETYGEKTSLQVTLDGTDESLDRLITKLKALNEALKSYQAQLPA